MMSPGVVCAPAGIAITRRNSQASNPVSVWTSERRMIVLASMDSIERRCNTRPRINAAVAVTVTVFADTGR